MIDGVIITPLKQFVNEQGKVMHMLRKDDPAFRKFGEIYFSVINPEVVKGWHLHKKSTSNYAVPVGQIKLVLFDPRKSSHTHGEIQEIITGEENYILVTIPAGIWSSFKCISSSPSLLANCSSHQHNPKDTVKEDLFSKKIPYKWKQ